MRAGCQSETRPECWPRISTSVDPQMRSFGQLVDALIGDLPSCSWEHQTIHRLSFFSSTQLGFGQQSKSERGEDIRFRLFTSKLLNSRDCFPAAYIRLWRQKACSIFLRGKLEILFGCLLIPAAQAKFKEKVENKLSKLSYKSLEWNGNYIICPPPANCIVYSN